MKCLDCHEEIYETVILNTERKQYVHTRTGCHYCDSVSPNPKHVAEPEISEEKVSTNVK